MQLEDLTPGDTILVNTRDLEFTATVVAIESIPDSLGRRLGYVRFAPNAPHEHLVYYYCFPNEVSAILRRGTDNDPED